VDSPMGKDEGAQSMLRYARQGAWGKVARILRRRWTVLAPDLGRRPVTPAIESLEGRRLLSAYYGPSVNRPVITPAGAFLIQVSGPGVVQVFKAPRGEIDLTAYGTTSSSTITVTQTKPRYHATSRLLTIRDLRIRSGQLGGLSALPADLDGRMTPLTSSVNTFAIGMIGPRAQVDINGSVGSLSVSNIDLGPTGHVSIAGDVNSIAQAGPLTIGAVTIDGGRLSIGRDSLSSISINGDVSISQDGKLAIGRDEAGAFVVNGSMTLSSGGQLVVGRNLTSLAVIGNLVVKPSGSGIAVDGALESLGVGGYFLGQGGKSAPSAVDLGVGLNLSGLTILGGISGQGGLINANIRAGGSVGGVNIPYGTANSTIQSNATMTT
jgi:hypothetical protein